MIKFIIGRSGSGKTERIHKYIEAEQADKNIVLIVPEQSSFRSEKRILETMGAKRSRNIEVLSFKRLCDNIFDKYKGLEEKRIDDGIKAVLMSMAIENAPSEGGELELYGTSAKSLKKNMDLIELMLTAVNEYKMCLITPEKLFESASGIEDKILAAKLRDSARIYAAYNALLENTYADPDDDLIKLYDILGEHNYFENMSVFIDSFYGFSAQEIKIVERIFSQAENVYISVCCDRNGIADKNSIFAEPNHTYRTLLRSVEKSGKKYIVEGMPDDGVRYANETLKALERGIFSAYRHGGFKCEKQKNDGSVVMYGAADIYDEAEYVAKTIFNLVHSGNYDYSDIEIIGRAPENYSSVFASEFPKYDIPYFLSSPEPLEIKPLIRLILSAFEVVLSGFDTEAVLRLAKTGLTPLNDYETYVLENYCYVWNIRGKRWKQEFTMSTTGNREENGDGENERIEYVENIRKKLIIPLIEFEHGIKKAETGAEMTVKLYELLEVFNCREKFKYFIKRLNKNGNSVNIGSEAGVWDTVMKILGNLYDVLDGKSIDIKRYADLLAIYIRKSPISDIPQTINSVTIGTAGNIRSQSPKVVFAIGAVENVFPAQAGPVGIFTDSERRYLRDEQGEGTALPLYDSVFGASLKEKMNVYTTLSAPSEKLYVSWYLQDFGGNGCEPSVIKREIESVLDGTDTYKRTEVTNENPTDGELFFTERQAFDVCAQLWNTHGVRSGTLKNYFRGSPRYCDRISAIERAVKKESFRLKNNGTIRKLYGSPLRLSNTKINLFAKCKFSYFCQYGLKAYPLKKADMDSGMYGSSVHYVFERLFKNLGTDTLIKMNEGELKAAVDNAVDEYILKIGDGSERSNRFNAMCGKIKRNSFKVLMRMCEQFRKDKFRPVDFEVKIGDGSENENPIPFYNLDIPGVGKILVNGIVDRIDTAEINGKKYVRIIDYKTGTDKFEFDNIANGINIQMFIYLSAILRNGSGRYGDGKVLLPAGVLYVPSTTITEEGEANSKSEIERAVKEQNKGFKMSGLLIDNEDVLNSMEEGLKGEFIPAQKTKTSGVYSKYSSIVSEEEFAKILDYVDVCIKETGMEIYSGNINAMPIRKACEYCDYSSVCRFEKGSAVTDLPKYGKQKLLNKINDYFGKSEEEQK